MKDHVEFKVVSAGGKFRCVFINDYRVVGTTPSASEGLVTVVSGKIKVDDLAGALLGTGYRLARGTPVMRPDRSRRRLLLQAEIFSARVRRGVLNDSAVKGLLTSLANHWCDYEVRSSQIAEAVDHYRSKIREAS